MKKSIYILVLAIVAFSFSSCKKCKGEDPISRIINNGTETCSVHIMTSGGNTVNINNILPGQTSADKSFAAGEVDFTISVGNLGDKTVSVIMEECWEYEITIDANNNVTSVPHDRNE